MKSLDAFMQATGMTQAQVANLLHISQAHFSNILAGRAKPSADVLKSIVEVLNVDAESVLKLSVESDTVSET